MNSNLNFEASILLMAIIIFRLKNYYCQVLQPEKLKKKKRSINECDFDYSISNFSVIEQISINRARKFFSNVLARISLGQTVFQQFAALILFRPYIKKENFNRS